MRVLLTTDTIGGVWTFTKDLLLELLEQGHAVALVSFGHPPSAWQATWIDEVSVMHGAKFRYVQSAAPLEWMQNNDLVQTEAFPEMYKIIRDFAPDLIHSGQFCFGSLATEIPVIVTAHSDVLSWAEACSPSPPPSTPWLRRYRQLVEDGLEGAAAVVAPTRWMLDALARNFLLPIAAHAILNGRTLPALPVPMPDRVHQAVSAGRIWDRAKNLDLLLASSPLMPILVAGDLGDGRSEAADEATRPTNAIRFLGALSESDLLTLFCQSALYVAPALYEPFGLAPLEAALCGCALLLFDLPSFHEVWGDAALYFHDRDSLNQALDMLFSGSSLLLSMQKRARERARAFTARRMTKQYLALYESALQPVEAALSAQ